MKSRALAFALLQSAESRPDAIAVLHDGVPTRYAELLHQAAAIAQFFKDRDLAPGARVALLLENSREYIAAYYGVLAAGGVVVALNTATKARDLSNWLRHCGASWLIADARHAEFKALIRDERFNVDIMVHGDLDPTSVANRRGYTKLTDVFNNPAASLTPRTQKDSDPAAIIYTSGTTGQPKGVTLSHNNLAANVASILAYLPLSADDRCLNVLPFYYSYGNSVLHTHLNVGASIVLHNSLMYPHTALETMARERVTGFYGVPSTYALLLTRTQLGDYDLSHLRYIAQAGGPMPPAHTARLLAALPQVKLFVMYGQTEATARLTYLPPAQLEQKLGAVGIPIPGVEIEIRDEGGNAVGVGVKGEIYARGDNIMSGYWNDAEGTAKALIDGWLKTGDLAHRDADGYLFIAGRSADMIKSGAHRINPKEIEEVIAELPDVDEVAVVGVADEILGQTIKAVIVLRPQAKITAMQIQAHCRQQLAAYKVPKTIAFAPTLPKTASGKIKRYMLTDDIAPNSASSS